MTEVRTPAGRGSTQLAAQPEAYSDATERWKPRELQALDELGNTTFAKGARTFLVLAFVSAVTLVPVIEAVADFRANVIRRRELIAAGAPASEIPGRRPRALEILGLLPSRQAIAGARHLDDWVHLVPAPRRLRAYEDELSLNSAIGKVVRPWAQWVLTGWLGTGSQQVVYGNDGWLFYNDGVKYVLGPGFLEPTQLEIRTRETVFADPRPAIYQLNNELEAVGVTLVLLPVPDKAVVHPSSFSRSATFDGPIQNRSWNAFVADVRHHGIVILDLAPEMFKADRAGRPQFLPGDSHWSAAGIDLAAQALANVLESHPEVGSAPANVYTRRLVRTENGNDLVSLLRLPSFAAKGLGLFEPTDLSQVLDSAGNPWKADTSSGILLIGDSFLEKFSADKDSVLAAGFAEQLSYYLQRSVDRRTKHVFNTIDVVELLGTTRGAVRASTGRRKFVVWEFAMRKLAVGPWALLQ